MNKLLNKIKFVLGTGIAGAESSISTSKEDNGGNIAVIQKKEQAGTLAQDLLKGEVTQETQNLNDRINFIIEESDKKEVIGIGEDDMESFSIIAEYNKPNIEEIDENFKAILVQNTEPIASGMIDNIIEDNNILNIKEYYPLTVERECIARFPIEKYSYQMVIKNNIETPNQYQLEFYVSAIPDPIDRIKRMFTNEIEKLYNKKVRTSDVVNFNSIQFITNSAWGSSNGREYKFNNLIYKSCSLFNKTYFILKFIGECTINSKNIHEKNKSNEIRIKYKNNEKRIKKELDLSKMEVLDGGIINNIERIVYCEECGKEMKGLELNDWDITKQDPKYLTGLCQECLSKKIFKK